MNNSMNHTDIERVKCRNKYDNLDQPGLSYLYNAGNEPLKYSTVGQIIEEATRKYEEIHAIVSMHDGKRITYKEVLHQSDKLAAGFLSLGLEKGDKIALWAPNIAEWVIVFFAAARAGLAMVAINPSYKPLELQHALNITAAKALVCLDKYKTLNFYDTLQCLIPGLETSDAGTISSENVPSLKFIIVISEETLGGTYNYNDVLNAVDNNLIDDIIRNQNVSPEDTCNIQFSSGTTGKPKAVCSSHFQLVNNSYMISKRLDLADGQHIFCVQSPLFHVLGAIGCILTATQVGAKLVLAAPMYDSKEILKALEQERCTLILGTPTLYVDLINIQKEMKKKLYTHRAFITGSPWSPAVIVKIKDVLNIKKITYAYGGTETSGAVFISLPNAYENDQMNNDGYIADHVEVKVVDNHKTIVPFGTPGELYVRGYLTLSGYLGNAAATREVLDEDNWYKTGDNFILYQDGSGKVVGRAKDMIIRGGENISPTEIEDLINTHPDILESQVIGIEDERLGEEVCACVRLKEGVTLNLDSLKSFCEGKISNYKIPTYLKIMESFPKTPSGKVQKQLLRQQFDRTFTSVIESH
ncbi:hypothetical protein RI129_006591 [Pyrocoelia pectoralis]|uniref:Medium-chain acyl-CoA ligase ACSF2, mitochondrial n=1 Tax=Pyrocoelia pectoralis TaxID=417401 RepID=A0AAN7ZPQ3_9COLE